MVQIRRMESSLQHPGFVARVFGAEERAERQNAKPECYAAAYAAKEAFYKAMGVGITPGRLPLCQLLHDAAGAPYLSLSGEAAVLAAGMELAVSVTHEGEYAIAVVVALSNQTKESVV